MSITIAGNLKLYKASNNMIYLNLCPYKLLASGLTICLSDCVEASSSYECLPPPLTDELYSI